MAITAPLGTASIVKEREYYAGQDTREGERRLASERSNREGGRVYLRAPTREYRREGDLLLLPRQDRHAILDIEATTLVGYSHLY
jgi:hypothetical protein